MRQSLCTSRVLSTPGLLRRPRARVSGRRDARRARGGAGAPLWPSGAPVAPCRRACHAARTPAPRLSALPHSRLCAPPGPACTPPRARGQARAAGARMRRRVRLAPPPLEERIAARSTRAGDWFSVCLGRVIRRTLAEGSSDASGVCLRSAKAVRVAWTHRASHCRLLRGGVMLQCTHAQKKIGCTREMVIPVLINMLARGRGRDNVSGAHEVVGADTHHALAELPCDNVLRLRYGDRKQVVSAKAKRGFRKCGALSRHHTYVVGVAIRQEPPAARLAAPLAE